MKTVGKDTENRPMGLEKNKYRQEDTSDYGTKKKVVR